MKDERTTIEFLESMSSYSAHQVHQDDWYENNNGHDPQETEVERYQVDLEYALLESTQDEDVLLR